MNQTAASALLRISFIRLIAIAIVLLSAIAPAAAQCNANLALSHTGTSCAGTDTLHLTGIDSVVQITWYNDTTMVSIGTDSTYVPVVAGAYHAVVATATCADTTAALTVSPLPSAVITVQGSLHRCQGDSVRLTAPTGNTYLWSNGDTARIIYAYMAGPYNVTVTSSTGCTAVSSDDTVTFAAPVQPDVTISSDLGDTICMNTQVTFYAQPVNGGSNPQYQWKRNGANVSNTATYIGTLLLDGETIWCVLTSNATCASPRRDTSTIITMTVLANPSVSVSGSSVLCSGDTTTLTAVPSGTSYLWSTGATTATIQAATAGTYSMTVTDANGCSAGATYTLTASTAQQATVTQNGDTLVTAATAEYYQWYYDGTIISGATGSVVAATQSGFYQVATIDSEGCRSTSQAVAIIVAGVADIAAVSGMQVYPNPTNGSFAITWTDDTRRDIMIADETGRVLLADDNITDRQRRYDLGNVAAGCYFVRVTQAGVSKTMKLAVAK